MGVDIFLLPRLITLPSAPNVEEDHAQFKPQLFFLSVNFLFWRIKCAVGLLTSLQTHTHTHTRPSAAGVKESFSFQRSCRWSQQLCHGRRSSSCHSQLCDLPLKDSTVMLMKSDPPEGEDVGGGAKRKKENMSHDPVGFLFFFSSSFLSSLSGKGYSEKCRLNRCS